MERYLASALVEDLKRKPVLLSGPRQCGKTYLSQRLCERSFDCFNYDIPADRKRLLKREWFRDRDLVIFDELHKMKKWKNWLKGIFDSDEEKQKFLVTGSARLNTYKKAGDSLAGRYFSCRLYPFDLKELREKMKDAPAADRLLDRLLAVTGFPEPFLAGEEGFYGRWRQTHLDVILKQDILETESVKNIKQLETLVYLLTDRVGSPLSYNSLREDLSTDDKSVKRWIDILEDSYVVFRISPYSRNVAGGIKKAPKLYFFDYVRVEDSAQRLGNLVAFSLLKEIHFRRDIKGQDSGLIRDNQHIEVTDITISDFGLVTADEENGDLTFELRNSQGELLRAHRAFAPTHIEFDSIETDAEGNEISVGEKVSIENSRPFVESFELVDEFSSIVIQGNNVEPLHIDISQASFEVFLSLLEGLEDAAFLKKPNKYRADLIAILEKARKKYERGKRLTSVSILEGGLKREATKVLKGSQKELILDELDNLVLQVKMGLETYSLRTLIQELQEEAFYRKARESKTLLLSSIDVLQRVLERRKNYHTIVGAKTVLMNHIKKVVKPQFAEELVVELNKIAINLLSENETKDLLGTILELSKNSMGYLSGLKLGILVRDVELIQKSIDAGKYDRAEKKVDELERMLNRLIEEEVAREKVREEIDSLKAELTGQTGD